MMTFNGVLKKIRVTIAIVVAATFTFLFIDYAGVLPNTLLTHFQFVPALMTALSFSVLPLLLLIVITLLFGRIYCSVLCPLGIEQDFVAWLSKLLLKVFKRNKKYSYSKPKTALRWSIFGTFAISLIVSFTFIVGILDPYAQFGRIATHLFKPVYLFLNNILADYFEYTEDYYILPVKITIISTFSFVIAVVSFLVTTVLAALYGRTYCNTICPVGTLLGLLSKFSLLKININDEKCNSCGLCAMKCKSSCIDTKNNTIDHSRCVECFNCINVCNKNAISYSISRNKKRQITAGNNTENTNGVAKRQLIKMSLAATLGTLLVPSIIKSQNNKIKNLAPTRRIPVTPPGSISHQHLTKYCVSCHLCIAKCPQGVIKPSENELGLSGKMQSVLDFSDGYCTNCAVCAEVCPTHAIIGLGNIKEQTQIGFAVFDEERCVVTTKNISCGKCAEVCPTNAITMVKSKRTKFTIPQVDKTKCIGCGKCEYFCPTKSINNKKAIWVQGNKVHSTITQ